MFIIIFAIICGLIGRFICLSIFDSIVGNPKKEQKHTYIDNSVTHHHYDQRTANLLNFNVESTDSDKVS